MNEPDAISPTQFSGIYGGFAMLIFRAEIETCLGSCQDDFVVCSSMGTSSCIASVSAPSGGR